MFPFPKVRLGVLLAPGSSSSPPVDPPQVIITYNGPSPLAQAFSGCFPYRVLRSSSS